MELTISLLQLYSLRATDEPTMLSSFKTLICSIKLTSKESNTGRKNEFALICSRQIYAANLWQLRSKSGENMVNATYVSLLYLQPIFLVYKRGIYHLCPIFYIFGTYLQGANLCKTIFCTVNNPHTGQRNQQLCQGTYLIIVSLKFLIFFFKKRYFSFTLPLQFFNCFLVFSMAITKKIIIPRWRMTWKIKLRHFCDKNRRSNLRYLDKTVTWWY